MGASFRNVGQIEALAGCDLLTISPELLAQLQASERAAAARARPRSRTPRRPCMPLSYNEASFRFALNDDAMATEKLAEGIRAFAADAAKLDQMIEARQVNMSSLRRDRGLGRAAGHFEAHGRELRPARGLRARRRSLRSAVVRGARGLCRPVEEPARRRDAAASCSSWRANAASRRTATRCSPATPINTTEGRAVLHTALRAPRGAGAVQRRGARRARRDARLRRDGARHDGAAASGTSSTSASAAATSGRRWWCRRSTPSRIRA